VRWIEIEIMETEPSKEVTMFVKGTELRIKMGVLSRQEGGRLVEGSIDAVVVSTGELAQCIEEKFGSEEKATKDGLKVVFNQGRCTESNAVLPLDCLELATARPAFNGF